MRAHSVCALTLIAWLAPLDGAHAGACDDLKAKVCANAKDARTCDGAVTDQLRDSDGARLSGMPRLMACRRLLDGRSALGDLQARTKSIGDPRAALTGAWAVDLERTLAADPKMREIPADAMRQAMAQARIFLGTLSFEFTADGAAVTMMGGNGERPAYVVSRGTYVVTRRAGDTLTVELTEGRGVHVKTETMTLIVGGDRLRMQQGGQQLVLNRK